LSTEITVVQQADAVYQAEGNMWAIVMVRFHTLLRCRRASHATQGYHVNWGEPASSIRSVTGWYAGQFKRKAKEVQAVGWPDSTCEGGESRWREAEKGQVPLCPAM